MFRIAGLPKRVYSQDETLMLGSPSVNSSDQSYLQRDEINVLKFAPQYGNRVTEWRNAYRQEVEQLEKRFLKPIVDLKYS